MKKTTRDFNRLIIYIYIGIVWENHAIIFRLGESRDKVFSCDPPGRQKLFADSTISVTKNECQSLCKQRLAAILFSIR